MFLLTLKMLFRTVCFIVNPYWVINLCYFCQAFAIISLDILDKSLSISRSYFQSLFMNVGNAFLMYGYRFLMLFYVRFITGYCKGLLAGTESRCSCQLSCHFFRKISKISFWLLNCIFAWSFVGNGLVCLEIRSFKGIILISRTQCHVAVSLNLKTC